MDKSLQKKLVGAAVLIALVVIFLPMLLDGEKDNESLSMEIEIPEKPVYEIPNRLSQPEPVGLPAVEADIVQPPQSVAVVKPLESLESRATGSEQAVKEVKATPPGKRVASTKNAPQPSIKPLAKLGKLTPQVKKPKASTKPASASASSVGKGAGYVVQVGSFSQQGNAEGLKDKLEAAGFPAFVQTVAISNKSVFRVKVGPRPNRDDADRLRLRLIDKSNIEGIIVAHP